MTNSALLKYSDSDRFRTLAFSRGEAVAGSTMDFSEMHQKSYAEYRGYVHHAAVGTGLSWYVPPF